MAVDENHQTNDPSVPAVAMKPDDGSGHRFWRRQALWIAPAVILIISGTFALAARDNGVDMATILAVPIGTFGLMIGVIALLLPSRQGGAAPSGRRRDAAAEDRRGGPARAKWAAAGASLLLVATSAAVIALAEIDKPDPPGPGAREFLTGTVPIGVNGSYPGWSSGDDSTGYDGFDVALAKWLADRYKFTPRFIKLDPSDRAPRIQDGTVKLVIANFSINPANLAAVAMAGPYYQDESGVWFNFDKKDRLGSPPFPACVARNTSNATKLSNSKYYAPTLRNSLTECLRDFYNENSGVALVVSDRSILEAYSGSDTTPVQVFSGKGSDVQLGGAEYYGVGLPKGFVELCEDLNGALDDFITSRWDSTFGTYLSGRGIAAEGHRPAGTNSADCD